MTDTRPRAVRLWACQMLEQREAMLDCAQASVSMSPVVPVVVIEARFGATPDSFGAKRMAVWEFVWDMQREEIIIGEETIEVFVCNQAWMSTIAAAFITGDITVCEPYCEMWNFTTSPVFLEPC